MITYERLKKLLTYHPLTGKWNWNCGKRVGEGCTRIQIMIDGKMYYSSRLAWLYMEGYWPEHEIDHWDRNKLNDKWENLRHATHQCNCKNRGIFKTNKSGVTGVYFYKWSDKWGAFIYLNKRIHLGYFKRFYDAVKARWDAEVKYEYPNCNSSSTAYKYLNMKRIKANEL